MNAKMGDGPPIRGFTPSPDDAAVGQPVTPGAQGPVPTDRQGRRALRVAAVKRAAWRSLVAVGRFLRAKETWTQTVPAWLCVIGVGVALKQLKQSDAQWTAGGAHLEVVSAHMGRLAEVRQDMTLGPGATYQVFLVTNTGRLQVDIAGAQLVDPETSQFVDEPPACNDFPRTIPPGGSMPVVTVRPGQTTYISFTLRITTADGRHVDVPVETDRDDDDLTKVTAAYEPETTDILKACTAALGLGPLRDTSTPESTS